MMTVCEVEGHVRVRFDSLASFFRRRCTERTDAPGHRYIRTGSVGLPLASTHTDRDDTTPGPAGVAGASFDRLNRNLNQLPTQTGSDSSPDARGPRPRHQPRRRHDLNSSRSGRSILCPPHRAVHVGRRPRVVISHLAVQGCMLGVCG